MHCHAAILSLVQPPSVQIVSFQKHKKVSHLLKTHIGSPKPKVFHMIPTILNSMTSIYSAI